MARFSCVGAIAFLLSAGAVALVACGDNPPPKTQEDSVKSLPSASSVASPSSAIASVSAPSSASSAPIAPPLPLACDGTKLTSKTKDYCLVTSRRSFDEAARECERMHGRLAAFEGEAEEKAIAAQLVSPWGYGSGLWLGCSDEEAEGKWKCDGKPLAYKNWMAGKPDNDTALDDCLEWLADTGTWNDASCAWQLGYVCKGDAKLKCATGKKVASGASVLCAHGEAFLDWDAAGAACKKDGGKLATITADDARAMEAALALPSKVPSWQPGEGVWIGLTDQKEEGKFRWSSGAALTRASWAQGQPDDANGGEDCASLTLGDGKWNDVDCIRALPFVCESIAAR